MTTTAAAAAAAAARPKVIVSRLGNVDHTNFDARSWPSGEFLLNHVGSFVVDDEQPISNNNKNNNIGEDGDEDVRLRLLPPYQRESIYWQVSARWALLKKYGRLPELLLRKNKQQQQQPIHFSQEEIDAIQSKWTSLVVSPSPSPTSSEQQQPDDGVDDLMQFLQSVGGRSNHRKLQWAIMDCVSGCQFRLHAHPNIELVYCLRGELHEIRMEGPPITKSFPPSRKNDDDDENDENDENNSKNPEVEGPNHLLLQSKRKWYFDTVRQGEWLVNEVGSVHKSFTSTSGTGVVLLVLWGGSHADFSQNNPCSLDVEEAVQDVDRRLGLASCENDNCTTDATAVLETFLPVSERRAPIQ